MTGILLILAGLSTGVYGSVRAAARKSVCASNERQLGMALIQYASDWDSLFPKAVGRLEIYWPTQIASYIRTPPRKLCCPDHTIEPNHLWQNIDSGYAMNRCVVRRAADRNSSTVLLTEVADVQMSPSATIAGPVIYIGQPDAVSFGVDRGGFKFTHLGAFGAERHSGSSHYFCTDGHLWFGSMGKVRYQTIGDECGTSLTHLSGSESSVSFPVLE